jgi:hypothetical protein
MMSPDYKKAAHRRTVFQHLQRVVMEYIDSERPAKEPLLCEDVFFSDRVVPQETLLDILTLLQAQESKETEKMSRFTMRERETDVEARTDEAVEDSEPGIRWSASGARSDQSPPGGS